jgi:hypothetical protein
MLLTQRNQEERRHATADMGQNSQSNTDVQPIVSCSSPPTLEIPDNLSRVATENLPGCTTVALKLRLSTRSTFWKQA